MKRKKPRWGLFIDGLSSATEICRERGTCRRHQSHVPSFEAARKSIISHLTKHAHNHTLRAKDYLDGVFTWREQTEKGWKE